MDTSLIVKAAMGTVGIIQILKNFITFKNNKLWTLPTFVIGIGLSCLGLYVNDKVLDVILVVCLATLFYDTVYRALENLAHNAFRKDDDKE